MGSKAGKAAKVYPIIRFSIINTECVQLVALYGCFGFFFFLSGRIFNQCIKLFSHVSGEIFGCLCECDL